MIDVLILVVRCKVQVIMAITLNCCVMSLNVIDWNL